MSMAGGALGLALVERVSAPLVLAQADVDELRLNFDESSVLLLNVILALIMFGVALDIRVEDFRQALKTPRGPAIGLVAQFLLLPAGTFALTRILDPHPSIALGMILVASCPGGNMSNFITHVASGNTVLSIGMTAISTSAAVVMTPLNLAFWGSLHPDTAALLREVAVNPAQMFITIGLLLGVPVALGAFTQWRKPALARKLRTPMRRGAVGVFIVFLVVALVANFEYFLEFVGLVVFAVFLHNAFALAAGYTSARALRLPRRDARAISIEVGIQNSALGLALIFAFFGGLGGMALVAAWWGIWHIIAGLSLAWLWARRPTAPAVVGVS